MAHVREDMITLNTACHPYSLKSLNREQYIFTFKQGTHAHYKSIFTQVERLVFALSKEDIRQHNSTMNSS
jgi:hypothetical protein